jgi:hypothetical protein
LWGCIVEPILDLANELIQNIQWDEAKLFDPLSISLLTPVFLPPDLLYATGMPLSIDVPINDRGKGDLHIDDCMFTMAHIASNIEWAAKAIPLAINCVARPLDRKALTSEKIFLAEPMFEETKSLLGWSINTKALQISLPINKLLVWLTTIDQMLRKSITSWKHLAALIGGLNHVAYTIPMMRHFMSRLQEAMAAADRNQSRCTVLNSQACDDLLLRKSFLNWAANGISMNLISYYKPMIFFRFDASENGIGGYSIQGKAWRFELPVDCRL